MHPSHTSRPRPGPRRAEPGWLSFLVGFASGVVALALVHALLGSSLDGEIELVRTVRDTITRSYIERTDSRELIDDALRGMVGGLDRYSHYFSPDEMEALERETSGEYLGIGVVFLRPVGRGLIRFTLPGSPADRAGLRVGDHILEVDGRPVPDMADGELRSLLRRERSEDILLALEGLDGERREVSLRAEKVVDPSVRHARMIDEERGIGYLAILSFSHRTPEEFDDRTRHLLDEGMRALILDLRSNPGGMLDSAVAVADRFLDGGTIVSTRTRDETRRHRADSKGTRFRSSPLVVLVDGGAASASEVLAGALQDHRRGVIVGEPTYGKGAVQELHPLDHATVKLTTSKYLTPAGRGIERGSVGSTLRAITPDLLVETPGEVRERIHGFLGTYSPPPEARSALEAWEERDGIELLARVPPDPQLEAALELLRGNAPGPGPRHVD